MFKVLLLAVVVALVSLCGCSQVPDSEAYQSSVDKPDYLQADFDSYVMETRDWLFENRHFISADKGREISANAPYQLAPKKPGKVSKGILLVHGLGDSPYSFVDIAPVLAEQGFWVRVILLPGHGSRPADLLWAKQDDWEKVVAHHTKLLQQQVDEVWLGGFSTGANLVTSLAIEDKSIKGLVLFSPAFEPNNNMLPFASFAANFMDWVDIDPENNYVRYDSLTTNAAGEYYKTSQKVQQQLQQQGFDRPTLLLMSEGDSVIDANYSLQAFKEHFTHQDSRFIWYGNNPDVQDDRVMVLNASLPEKRISNFSHMAPLFAPNNDYYGVQGEFRICNNGGDPDAPDCLLAEPLWYSSYGFKEDNKTHARLTWNPYFEHFAKQLNSLVSE